MNTIGIFCVAFFGYLGGSLIAGKEQVDLAVDQGGRGGIRRRRIAFGETDVERDIPAFLEAERPQASLEALDGGVVRRPRLVEDADAVGTEYIAGVGLFVEKLPRHRECTQRANRDGVADLHRDINSSYFVIPASFARTPINSSCSARNLPKSADPL